eukprot:TRINITY_DN3929_c0_g1_i1.p1 TRINITY_DN3929_c0_g1~~TRINITY_DN3929_c0_g1_i1.p1  ORF type:complete len:353 (+),score=107.84 TRINITY_DN3929_c0_g1_i1:42-1100(+)
MGWLSWLAQMCWTPGAAAKAAVFGGEDGRRAVVEGLRNGRYKNIVVLTGAGISCAAGIPDFRSRAGLYELSHKFQRLPSSWSVFDMTYFREDPVPFYYLVRKMMFDPDTLEGKTYRPTLTHCFFALLEEKNILKRVFTQNVDCLDTVSGLSAGRLQQMHGTIRTAKCIACKAKAPVAVIEEALRPKKRGAGRYVYREPGAALDAPTWEVPLCPKCGGIVKLDVVLFNDALPCGSLLRAATDLPACDLLLCIGSTFQVMPFATLIGKANELTPRVLINREEVAADGEGPLGASVRFKFHDRDNYRDVFIEGDCDASLMAMCEELGWAERLKEIHTAAGEVGLEAFRRADAAGR